MNKAQEKKTIELSNQELETIMIALLDSANINKTRGNALNYINIKLVYENILIQSKKNKRS